MGVTREAGASIAGPERGRAWLVVVLVAAAGVVGTGLVALRGHAVGTDKITAEPSAARTAADPVVPSANPSAPSVVLAPESSASPLSSAVDPPAPAPTKPVAKVPVAATTAATATTPPAPLPTQLGDLKLH
jgi:hypothetical protein